MAGFRGIGDSATQAKMQQDQQKLQAAQISESARQADLGRVSQAQARAQQASQFDKSQAQQASQFDTAQAAAADKDAWQRDFAERTAATESGLNERKMNLADFGARLNEYVASADLENKDVDTRLKRAQLGAYVSAMQDEQRKMKNREANAIRVFTALGRVAGANGGTIPAAAGDLAARDLDIKNGSIRGGIDMDGTGNTYYDIIDEKGQKIQKSISPYQMYSAIFHDEGKEAADMWADMLKHNMTAMGMIKRAQVDAETKTATDPVKAADMLRAAGEAKIKAADATFDMAEKKRLVAEGTKTISEAEIILRGTTPGAAGRPAAAAPEVSDADISAAGVPPGYRKQIDPATGDTVVYWRENGKTMSAKFPAGGQKKKGPSAASQVISVMGALP